jgi:tetratricopeptide (TPR) repeat protein
MRRILAVSLLGAAFALAPAAHAQAGSDAQGGQQQVVIKDQAEYQAYNSAVNQADPKAKAQALEAFLQQYPNSVAKKDVLNILLATYQQLGDQAKLSDTASRILQNDPNNEQAALVVAFYKAQQAQQAVAANPTNPKAAVPQFKEAADAAQKALDGLNQLKKPDNVDQAQFDTQKQQIEVAMNATIGEAHYFAEEYDQAIQPLFRAVQLNPQDVADMEYLGISMAKPVTRQIMYQDPAKKTQLLAGTFWLMKAASLAPAQAKPQFTQTAQYYYTRYHGSKEGFDQAMAQAAQMPQPAPEFNVAAAPSPQEQVQQELANTPPDQILVKDGFDTWATVLQVAQPTDAQKVWDATKGKEIDVPGTVIAATPQELQLAVSDQAVQDKRADVIVQLKTPLTTPPAPGTENYEVLGTADSYTPKPFVLTLINARPKAAPPKKATPPARRGTTHKRPTSGAHK